MSCAAAAAEASRSKAFTTPKTDRLPPSSRGFTLVELMVSIAIVGMLLVALNSFLFSMGELWGRNADVRLFDQHVNAVTRFLASELSSAVYPPSARANATPVTAVQITPAAWGCTPGFNRLSWAVCP